MERERATEGGSQREGERGARESAQGAARGKGKARGRRENRALESLATKRAEQVSCSLSTQSIRVGALPAVRKKILLHLDVALIAQAGNRPVDRLRAAAKVLGELALRFTRPVSTDRPEGNIAEQAFLHRGEILALFFRGRFYL